MQMVVLRKQQDVFNINQRFLLSADVSLFYVLLPYPFSSFLSSN